MIALVALASAATVAVLELDGYGVDRAAAGRAAEGLRDAFQQGGVLDPLTGGDVAAGLSAGADESLRRGREALAEARRLQAGGDQVGALGAAERAEGAYRAALADLGLRTELADALYVQARCLVALDRSTEAWFALREVEHLHPGYLAERGGRAGETVERLYAEVEKATLRGERREFEGARLARAEAALGVDYVVVGWLDLQGRLRVELWDEGKRVEAVDAALSTMPPSEADPVYARVAGRLVDPLGPPRPHVAAAEAPAPEAPPPEPTRTVVDRWWFWASAGVVLAGGGAAVTALVVQPEDRVVVQPASWGLEVVVP